MNLQRIGIAIGAGLAAALLFAVLVKETLLALALSQLAPLPIIIVSLGWGLDIGAMAGAIAVVAAAGLVNPSSAAVFAFAVALPAWLLSFATLSPRDRFLGRRSAPDGEKVWIPIGGIVTLVALVGILAGAGTLAWLILAYGDRGDSIEALAAALVPDLLKAYEGVFVLPGGVSIDDIAAMFVRVAPAGVAMTTCLMLCANLYAGARAVQLSQRLKRPWPNLPESFVLPRFLGIGLVACTGLALLLSELGAYAAWIGVGALGSLYVMQGLAVLHALSRGLPVRVPALVALYFGCAVTVLWSLPALALVGLVDSLLSLRARRAAAAKRQISENEIKRREKWK
jgi:hypothetical protein